MGIFRETKEEVLAKSIEHVPRRTKDVVLSQQQKELDFDEQILAALGSEQAPLKDAITRCSDNLVTKTEAAITDNAKPTHVDQLLRIALWEEISDALHDNRPVSERAIYSGVCSYSYWKNLRDVDDEKFTYLLIPVKSYSRTNKLLLSLGQSALIEILNADPYVKSQGSGYKKQLDPKIAKVQLEAYRMVEERIYGKAVNRIQTHNTNESKTSDAHETIEALQQEIVDLENKHTPLYVEADEE